MKGRRSEAIALACLGRIDLAQGYVEEAREHFNVALALSREVGDRHTEGSPLNALGVLHTIQGCREEARSLYEAALTLAREFGDRSLEGRTLGNLGGLERVHGYPTVVLLNSDLTVEAYEHRLHDRTPGRGGSGLGRRVT